MPVLLADNDILGPELRLLFARVGRPHCLRCGERVLAHRFEEANETAAGMPEGTRLVILAPRQLGENESPEQFLEWVDRAGFRRVRIDGQDHLLEELTPEQITGGKRLAVVVDRLVVKGDAKRRVQGSLEAALEVGNGQIALARHDEKGHQTFSVRPACSSCGTLFRSIEPGLFSFNNPAGACGVCRGLGVQSGLSLEQVFVGGRATLEGALGALWQDFGHGDLRVDPEVFAPLDLCACAAGFAGRGPGERSASEVDRTKPPGRPVG